MFLLVSCGPTAQFLGSPPDELTVQNALADVGNGLAEFRAINAESGGNSGLLLDEVTITLNVTNSRSGKNELVIDSKNIAPPALSGGNVGGSFKSEQSGKNERSNTIVLKFKNKYTASLNEIGKKGPGPNDTYLYSYGIPFQCPPICPEKQ
jgi:hypothetical protein